MSNTNFQKFLFLKANESIKTNLNNFQKLWEQTDRIIVWLVGFSITAITLLIANYNNANSFINHISEIIILFSGATIFFGILYRISLLLFQKSELNLIISLDQFVTGYDLPDDFIYSKYITTKNTSYKDVLILLDQDFDLTIPMQNLSTMSLEEQNRLHQEVVNKYNERQEKQLKFEVELFEKDFSELIGTKTSTKEKQKSNNRWVWRYLKITNFLFSAACVTFLIGIFILIGLYLTYEIPNKKIIDNTTTETQTLIESNSKIKDKTIQLDTVPKNINPEKSKLDTSKGK